MLSNNDYLPYRRGPLKPSCLTAGRPAGKLERIAMPLPTKVRIDASTACQLRCPSCPTTAGTIGDHLGTGLLTPDRFETFLDRNPGVRSVELSNWGEILLNPALPAILEAAHRRGVAVSAENGVNLNRVSPEALEAIVDFGLRRLTVSIDGASQETYAQYRVGGDFDTVIANLDRLLEVKKAKNSATPEIFWQFVVFAHNVHEIGAAKEMAEARGVTLFLKPSWDETLAPEAGAASKAAAGEGVAYLEGLSENGALEDDSLDEAAMGSAERRRYRVAKMLEKHGAAPRIQDTLCMQMWDAPQINHDGRLLGCCVNYWGDYGNVFDEGFEETFNGERMEKARAMLTGAAECDDAIPCARCDHYTDMRSSGRWLAPEALRARRGGAS